MTRLQVRPVRHDQGDVDVIALAGELDLDSEDVLAAAVSELLRAQQDDRLRDGGPPAGQDGRSRRPRLVLDCAALTFCDSRGLGQLLMVRQRLENAGGVLILADVSPQLLRTLELTGADQVLTLVDTVGEVLLPVAPREPSGGEAPA